MYIFMYASENVYIYIYIYISFLTGLKFPRVPALPKY